MNDERREIEAGLAEFEGRDDPTVHPGYHRLLPGRRKDKRRWCKGHVGREHTPVRRRKRSWSTDLWVLACTRCGKELDYWFEPPRWWPTSRQRPTWMDD